MRIGGYNFSSPLLLQRSIYAPRRSLFAAFKVWPRISIEQTQLITPLLAG